MRRFPAPLSVTLARPSSTTRRLVLTTLAVSFITILTLPGPQRKRMTPPLATARTTARDVQLRAVPWPTQRSGCAVLTARASGGTGTAAAATDGVTRRAAQMSVGAMRRDPRQPTHRLRMLASRVPDPLLATLREHARCK